MRQVNILQDFTFLPLSHLKNAVVSGCQSSVYISCQYVSVCLLWRRLQQFVKVQYESMSH